MKRYLLLSAVLILLSVMCASAFADTGVETTVSYEELPQAHRTLVDLAMAEALANVQKNLPAKNRLQASVRGDFNGYTDSRSDNGLKVDYRVSDSVVKVGEKITFMVNASTDTPPMYYTVSGLVFDDAFENIGSLNSSVTSTKVEDGFKSLTFSFKPAQTGYLNFVFAVTDEAGNKVYVITSTVMICEEDDPIFQNQSVDVNVETDGNLGVMLGLDRAKLSVGTVIAATADMTTTADPVRYRGMWTLLDGSGNILDTKEAMGEVSAKAEPARVVFEYRPLQAGKLQFVLNANDGEGNRLKTNTPVLTVEDNCYLTAGLDRTSAVAAGDELMASYQIHGHACPEARYEIAWECIDADGDVLLRQSKAVTERAGQDAFTPRIGQTVEFSVSAACVHFPDVYPAIARIALIGGVEGEVSLTKTSVNRGEAIGVTYAFEGGNEPYRKVAVKGYARDAAADTTSCFVEWTGTAGEGTVSGIPETGSEVYFVVELTEADGYTSTWTTARASVTEAAGLRGDADGSGQADIQDVLRIMQHAAGWPVEIHAANADVDGNDSVNLSDAAELLRILNGGAV